MATASVVPNVKGQAAPGAIPVGGYSQQASNVADNVSNPNVTNPLATTTANPYAAPTATTGTTVPVSSAVPQTNGVNWVNGSNTVIGDFSDTYGNGTGQAITSVLSNMGTATDNAVQATTANANLNLTNQLANVSAQGAAQGLTPNSSAEALEKGDTTAAVDASLNQTTAGMELSEEDTLLQSLMTEGSAHGTDGSTMDSIMNGVGDAATIAGGAIGAATGVEEAGGIGALFGL